jgi:hypothetical protein
MHGILVDLTMFTRHLRKGMDQDAANVWLERIVEKMRSRLLENDNA